MRISTGLILCAGFGKRVAPLTNTTPKPLLQIKNVTLLENSINFLKKCGIKKIKINTHYLSDEIENFIKKKNYKNEVELFFEKEILDTGGGIKNLVNNDSDENFLIINPDTIWKDNYLIEVEKMKKFYFDNNLSNILMLVNKSRSFDKRFKGDFTLKDTYERVIPFYKSQIENKLDNNIVVSAHGNSIRSMCKFLFELDNDEVTKLEIPTGNPLKITFNNEKKLTGAIYLDKSRAKNLIKF